MVEHLVYTEDVGGSIPSPPTIDGKISQQLGGLKTEKAFVIYKCNKVSLK